MKNDITITRLREANPVHETGADSADELFAAIVARPGDPRLEARQSRRLRRGRAATVAIVVGLMALLASTAYAAYQALQDAPIVDPEVTKQEYQRATRQLTLPPGTSWPDWALSRNSVTTQGGGGAHAVVVAQHEWECYWVDAIRTDNDAAGREAHAALRSLLANNIVEAPAGASEGWAPQPAPDRPIVAYAHDGGLQWITDTYALAAAGHPQRLIQSCTANGG